jgi:outer membrane protein assembly factor BamE (lipoprotein component of BamABCDE complex)
MNFSNFSNLTPRRPSASGAVLLAIALALTGCASSGNRVLKTETKDTMAQKITEGKTTQTEVRQRLGDPTSTTFTDGGNEIWKYEFEDVSSDAINFVPVVNIFEKSYSGTKKELTILYDRGGVVQRYSLDESAITTKAGIAN